MGPLDASIRDIQTGRSDRFPPGPSGRRLRIREGAGIVSDEALASGATSEEESE